MVAYLAESPKFLKLIHTWRLRLREKREYNLTVRLESRPSPNDVVSRGVLPQNFMDRLNGKY
jgi:hypothetical protein